MLWEEQKLAVHPALGAYDLKGKCYTMPFYSSICVYPGVQGSAIFCSDFSEQSNTADVQIGSSKLGSQSISSCTVGAAH